MVRRSMVWPLVLAISLLIGPNAWAYKKVKVYIPQPPQLHLSGVKQIAVLDFRPTAGTSKDAGKLLADKMIEYLLNENRGIYGASEALLIQGFTTKCYSIVERSRLETVLNEQSLSQDGTIDDAQAVALGRILGVEVLIYGDVTVSVQDNNAYEKRVSFSGGGEYQVACLLRDVTLSATMRVVNTQTGEIIGTHNSGRKESDKFCEGDKEPITAIGTLAGRCANNLTWEFANVISPWYGFGEFELEKVKAKEGKDQAEEAAKAAENLEIEKAYAIYKKLYESDPYNPQYLYNLGVLYEVTGAFDKAREMYEGAVSLKADNPYREGVERIGRRAKLVSFCEAMGIALQPRDLEAAASNASLLAKRVTVKGGSDERVDVFEQPNVGSASVAKVPGGIQLEVIEESGDYYLVKLLGGKQGYLPRNAVKE